MPTPPRVAVIHVELTMCDLLRTLLGYSGLETVCLGDASADATALLARLEPQQPQLIVWNLVEPYAVDHVRARAVQDRLHCPIIFVAADLEAATAALDAQTAAALLPLTRDVSHLAQLSSAVTATLPHEPR